MATPGGYWRPRDPNRPMADPTRATPAGTVQNPAALGVGGAAPVAPVAPPVPAETPEQRAARTGVNVGGAGAVSGQVAPPAGSGTGTSALAALGGAPAPTGPAPIPGQSGGNRFVQPGAQPVPGSGGATYQGPAGATFIPQGGTATVTGALGAGVPSDGSVTRTSAITSSGGGANTGTTAGYSPLGPLAGPVGKIPVLGPIIGGLTTSSAVDLSPGLNAQRAAYGISDDIDRERYDYRPGEAPSMDIDSDIRRGQLTALGGLRDAATGAVPSAAELQMRREAGRNVAATLGQARALGGRSAGGAARAGTLAASDILSRNALQGAELRAAEQERARAAEVNALSGVRGQDTDISKSNLGAQLQTDELAERHRLALLDARLKALGIGSQTIGEILGAAKANAGAENAAKQGVVNTITGLAGL